ncbi:hypothetical protein [Microbacterium lacticum]|uniref:hypothetical protein n=1 Tax=Microbacterium lacticum TaxID=33885 RepID=UPI0028D6BBB5|nr:hypothetical protein [Microbacterium lacticum]
MAYEMITKGGHDFYVVASLLQKSLRRGDMVLAARAANELFPQWSNYVWNRLLTVSAEDCADMVTQEVVALFDAWMQVNNRKPVKDKGRVFIAKAIVLLAKSAHSRDADELNILVSDRFPESEWQEALDATEPLLGIEVSDLVIPKYTYDVHTRRGKRMGKTKAQFLREESDALTDRRTVFGNLDQMIDSPGYIAPKPLF